MALIKSIKKKYSLILTVIKITFFPSRRELFMLLGLESQALGTLQGARPLSQQEITSFPSLCLFPHCTPGTMMTLMQVVVTSEGMLSRMHLLVSSPGVRHTHQQQTFSHPHWASQGLYLLCLPLLADYRCVQGPALHMDGSSSPHPAKGLSIPPSAPRGTPSAPLPANAPSQTFLPLSPEVEMKQIL